jgi:2-oxoglutarate dehydrogenase E2 component (dihydrolipoamide succinyltransferase)
MSTKVTIPALGESVTEVVLLKWLKNDGDYVKTDESICELETDKANVEVPSPVSGALKQLKKVGDKLKIGDTIAEMDTSAAPTASKPEASKPAAKQSAPTAAAVTTTTAVREDLSPAVRNIVAEKNIDTKTIIPTGPGNRITKEDVITPKISAPAFPMTATTTAGSVAIQDGIRRQPMTKLRKKIAETLVSAQHNAAMLTTFNEVNMTEIFKLRERYKERFQEIHDVSLGIMSFFVRASILALQEFQVVNASIDQSDIVFHDYINMGIAVSTERGLVVPVLRHAELMSFAKIESEIKRMAISAREGKLGIDELSGGTFTITNGGVFGSLLSTPIINPPQSAILGMHTIQKRPIAVGDKVEICPMMYVALSYDHRLVDGKESVSFLVRVKQLLEDPVRLMLEV